jgi:SAM-dependent methyltransferase
MSRSAAEIAAPCEAVEPSVQHRAGALAKLILERLGRPARLLVVGCGSGAEAAALAIHLGAEVVGIDLVDQFDPAAARIARLQRGDATRLDFPAGSFDHVYSYHALEHIPDYRAALAEMRRVLDPRGGYCIGTPNRHRLVGYIGSPVPLGTKLRWNLDDWLLRARGRFRNELGAHAGFSSAELARELRVVFRSAEDVTLAYYLRVYARHAAAIERTARMGLASILFPSVYFVGSR